MSRFSALFACCVLCVASAALGQETSPVPAEMAIPAGESDALSRLTASPRHGEMIDIPHGEKTLTSWIVYPERKDKAPVVIVIHEIYGLTDWIRAVADQLAADGFIAIAPDLLSGMGPEQGGTASFANRDDVVKAVRSITNEKMVEKLNAVWDYAAKLPAATERFATVGFCWGGSSSFYYATQQPELDAAVVYYGTAPEDTDLLARIVAPVLGLYGEDDARVTSTVEATIGAMKAAGKTYEPEIYKGAGHGFLRAQAEREGANAEAARQGWERTLAFLRKHLEVGE